MSHTSKSSNSRPPRIRGIQNGWFTETATMWPGQRFSLALKDYSHSEQQDSSSILFHQTSQYQEILVFESAQYGKVFVIDGILQLTERDAFTFHEMMAHLPLFAHTNPLTVLIVGGGDGMVLREVLRHEQVQHVTLVEIDPMVIQASQECLQLVPPDVYQDSRVTIVHQDAADYVQQQADRTFDVILADTLDPIGPAESLFEPEFYEAMHAALKPGGIVCTQGENLFIHLDLIRDLVACCADIFDSAEYATTAVPSYPCGQIGFILARKSVNGGGTSSSSSLSSRRRSSSCSVPLRVPTFQDELKWYNPEMHRAAFVLPQYVKVELNAAVNGGGTSSSGWTIANGDGDEAGYYLQDDDEDEQEGDRCLFAGCSIQ